MRDGSSEELRQLRKELGDKTDELERIKSGLSAIQREQLRDQEVDIGPDPEPSTSIVELGLHYRLHIKCIYAGIETIEELISHTVACLRKTCKFSEGQLRTIISALDEFGGLRLKDCDDISEFMPVIAASADPAADDAIITEVLQKLGYEEWDLEDDGLCWAMEAIRFSMNNPKLAYRLKKYLWPEIAKREGFTVAEVTSTISASIKSQRPVWKKFKKLYDSCRPEDKIEQKVFDYAKEALRAANGKWNLDSDVVFWRELTAIARHAHGIRKAAERRQAKADKQ